MNTTSEIKATRQHINAHRGRLGVAYFYKKNGEPRRMVFIYAGSSSNRLEHLPVFDCEKGSPRTLNLATLERPVRFYNANNAQAQ